MELSTQTKQIIEKNNIIPNKKLGQNFLINKGIVDKIAQNKLISTEKTTIEVGTGIGTITKELSKYAKKVISIEKSEKIYKIAKNQLKQYKNIDLLQQDILRYTPLQPYVLVGAPPYYLTARLFRVFLQNQQIMPTAIILLIQKEVAQKIVQKPPKSSLLATSIQIYGTPKIETTVNQNSFYPQPKVKSAILTVENIKKPDIDEKILFSIIRSAYSNPRKTIFNNLSNFSKDQDINLLLKKNKIDPKRRAQTLSIEEWIGLAKTKQCA